MWGNYKRKNANFVLVQGLIPAAISRVTTATWPSLMGLASLVGFGHISWCILQVYREIKRKQTKENSWQSASLSGSGRSALYVLSDDLREHFAVLLRVIVFLSNQCKVMSQLWWFDCYTCFRKGKKLLAPALRTVLGLDILFSVRPRRGLVCNESGWTRLKAQPSGNEIGVGRRGGALLLIQNRQPDTHLTQRLAKSVEDVKFSPKPSFLFSNCKWITEPEINAASACE